MLRNWPVNRHRGGSRAARNCAGRGRCEHNRAGRAASSRYDEGSDSIVTRVNKNSRNSQVKSSSKETQEAPTHRSIGRAFATDVRTKAIGRVRQARNSSNVMHLTSIGIISIAEDRATLELGAGLHLPRNRMRFSFGVFRGCAPLPAPLRLATRPVPIHPCATVARADAACWLWADGFTCLEFLYSSREACEF
jgi:hypothetical protein